MKEYCGWPVWTKGPIGGSECEGRLPFYEVAINNSDATVADTLSAQVPARPRRDNPVRIAFSFIGGAHQFWHAVPVAAALSQTPDVAITCFLVDAEDAAIMAGMLRSLGSAPVKIVVMSLPRILQCVLTLRWRRRRAPLKVVRLAWWSRVIARSDVIVAVERTSVLLKWLSRRTPPMAHIPHGAGDRERGYDRRIRKFDYVLAAGEKDRDRFIELGLARPERIWVSGYVKQAGMRRLHRTRPRFFENNRPTIVYNPHFSHALGSWRDVGREVIAAIAADGRYNLIFAPHVRLLENATAHERDELEALARTGSVLIDLGSPRSIDMSYTAAADLYLGDVSSQVYEFCAEPRPCVFLNAHGVAWRNDPHYAMWGFGEVIERVEQLIPAVAAAFADPGAFAEVQREAVRKSFGDPALDAAQVAADRLLQIADMADCPALRSRQPSYR